MIKIPISKIRQFSEFYRQFIDGNSFILSRFSAYDKIFNENYLATKAKNFSKRKRARDIISRSMQHLKLTPAQEINLQKTTEQNTLFVATGQQVGFLGGPLYTALKIATAIKYATMLNEQHKDLHFIPLFWLEDNDHDAREAAQIRILDSNYNPINFALDYESFHNTPVSEIYFCDDIEQKIAEIVSALPYSQEKSNLEELLRSIYTPGKGWSQAMLEYYQVIFGESGLLFARAAECRLSGAVLDMADWNFASLNKFDELFDLFNEAKNLLHKNGFKANINHDYFNYCIHIENKRYSIKTISREHLAFSVNHKDFSYDEIVEQLRNHPEQFSPKAILRPVFQEMCFPSALYILGPGEIEYHSVLKEAYGFFQQDFPPVASRATACFVFPRFAEFIGEQGVGYELFFGDSKQFENFLADLVEGDFSENVFQQAKQKIADDFGLLREILEEADPSLLRTNDAYIHKTQELIDSLHKKYISAMKKKNSDKIEKYRRIRNLILPNEHLQERQFSPVNFMNFYGIEKFAKILNEIADNFVKEVIIYT